MECRLGFQKFENYFKTGVRMRGSYDKDQWKLDNRLKLKNPMQNHAKPIENPEFGQVFDVSFWRQQEMLKPEKMR